MYAVSNLHHILDRMGPLTAVAARDGDKVVPGYIYVATADHHLLVEKEKLIVRKGPRENRFRPSVDALFRSAAYTYGARVIGVVLLGALDDGTSGLWTIKRLGGMALIQHPEDALFPQMPVNAEQFVTVDYSVPASQMSALLSELTAKPIKAKAKITEKELALLETEIIIATRDNAFQMGIIEMGEQTPFTCPECHGALTQLREGELIRFRCHTGHAYTISSLLSEVSENVETILWQAMQALEETTMLLTRVGEHFTNGKQTEIAELFYKKADIMKHRSQLVHDTVLTQEMLSTDIGLAQPLDTLSNE